MTDTLADGTPVVLLTPQPGHPAGAHGHVHGSWASHTGVIFDTNPGYIRYIPADQLQPVSDEAVEDLELDRTDRVTFWAIAHHHDNDTICNVPTGCTQLAVWWWECACGTTRLGCEPHRAEYDLSAEHIHTRGGSALCRNCRTLIPYPLPWRAL